MTAHVDYESALRATAWIPEPFLDALRSGRTGDTVRIGAFDLVVASDGNGTTDPVAEVAAWGRVFEIRKLIRSYLAASPVDARTVWQVPLPAQITALAWEEGAYQIVVCASPVEEPARRVVARRHLSVVA